MDSHKTLNICSALRSSWETMTKIYNSCVVHSHHRDVCAHMYIYLYIYISMYMYVNRVDLYCNLSSVLILETSAPWDAFF